MSKNCDNCRKGDASCCLTMHPVLAAKCLNDDHRYWTPKREIGVVLSIYEIMDEPTPPEEVLKKAADNQNLKELVEENLKRAIELECSRAKKVHGDIFASAHEAESVIREELEEFSEEANRLSKMYTSYLSSVRGNDTNLQEKNLREMKKIGMLAITELTQVLAMLDKAMPNETGGETNAQ